MLFFFFERARRESARQAQMRSNAAAARQAVAEEQAANETAARGSKGGGGGGGGGGAAASDIGSEDGSDGEPEVIAKAPREPTEGDKVFYQQYNRLKDVLAQSPRRTAGPKAQPLQSRGDGLYWKCCGNGAVLSFFILYVRVTLHASCSMLDAVAGFLSFSMSFSVHFFLKSFLVLPNDDADKFNVLFIVVGDAGF